MNRFAVILLFVSSASAQINTSFIKHLSSNNLKREHLAYLSGYPDVDSTNYHRAKFHLQYFNDTLFTKYFLKSKALFLKDTNSLITANIRFLTGKASMQESWYNSYTAATDRDRISNTVHTAYMAALNPSEINADFLPENLRPVFLSYKKEYSKKPIVAGGLSMLVPGLGKFYAGRKRSFYSTLLTHIIYGIGSYESIRKLGIRHPFSIFSVSFFSVFYAANIYGSYNDVKQVKREAKTQFLINASEYYNLNYFRPLY